MNLDGIAVVPHRNKEIRKISRQTSCSRYGFDLHSFWKRNRDLIERAIRLPQVHRKYSFCYLERMAVGTRKRGYRNHQPLAGADSEIGDSHLRGNTELVAYGIPVIDFIELND